MTPNATTYESGEAFEKSLENEWSNYLASHLMQHDQPSFYEYSEYKKDRFTELTESMISKYGPSIICKAAIFSRNELGLRSISTYLAALLNRENFEGKRDFYKKFFHRPDDVAELFAAITGALDEKRSHALIRGACDYLNTLNEYQLGKYKMKNKMYNMYDLVRLTHANTEAINKLMHDNLEAPDTWEVRISTATSDAERNSEWRRLVESGSLGYLALIRNLRNILKCSFVDREWINRYLIPQITNKIKIRKSLVYPYQIYNAYKNIDMD